MQHLRFPSINQFRTVVKNVRDRSNFHGIPLPKIIFNGSVKLHGTCSSVIKDPRNGEIWCQSREQIITPENDNAGFASFISELSGRGIDIYFNIAAGVYGMNNLKPGDLIGIYGEWCGRGVQKGVAINQLSKRFVIFGIRIYTPAEITNDEDEDDWSSSVWFSPVQLIRTQELYEKELSETIGSSDNLIFSIQKFQTWTIEIDFAHPELMQNKLVEITDEVERCCPVGKAFGVDGVGEGVVYRAVSKCEFKTSDLIMKIKGEKHSDTKVKKTATVDIEKVNSINEFASNVVTDHRLEKMIEKLKEAGKEVDIKNTGEFLKLVGADVLKEETDTIEASGLDRKTIMPAVNNSAKQWYLKFINDFIMKG